MVSFPPGHQTRGEREREDDSPVTTAPFTCCFEFLETSVTACSHTHNWVIFMTAGNWTGVKAGQVQVQRDVPCWCMLFMWVLCLSYPSCPVNDREGERDNSGTCEVPSVSVCL